MNQRRMFQQLVLVTLGWFTLALQSVNAASLPDFTEMAETNGPAVVNISTTQHPGKDGFPKGFKIPDMPENGPWGDLFRHFFGQPNDDNGQFNGEIPESRSLGSGFIISEDGYILTNNHVIEEADEIIVRLNDRRELEAQVVGSDPRSDVALLKIDADNLPTVTIGKSKKLKVGEWVMAIGSPFGFDHSVSVGVVSAVGRSLPKETYVPFIQTDVAINPGNSGGPLFDSDGEVVGVNAQIYSQTGGFMGLSFAIPIDVAMEVVRQLKDRGYVSRGWLGVLIQDVTRDLAESFGMKKPSGALIAQVVDNSPADKAGFQPGDIILKYNGTDVIYSSDLPPLVGRTPVDSTAKVLVLRDGREKTLEVEIAELPPEEQLKEAAQQPQSRPDTNRLGMAVKDLTKEQRSQMELSTGGVLVTKVGDGPAAEAGIRKGDIITRINNIELTSAHHFSEVVSELPKGRSVPVLVIRREGPMFLALKVPEE